MFVSTHSDRPALDAVSSPSVQQAKPATSMRRVSIRKAGSYDRLELVDGPALEPGPGEVVVDVKAIGVNYADCMVRMGLYASAKEFVGWPITPGFETAGVVAAVGDGVDDLSVGDRVFALTLFGGYASQVKTKRAYVFPMPKGLSFEQAASFPSVYLTAWYALHELAHPRAGQRILIHSAAGGVGGCLVQLAKRAGCEVTGVVGGSHKVDVARDHGCDHVIDKSQQKLWDEAERIAPEGYDVICDANGIATLKQSYVHLRPAGKLVVYGFHTMMPRKGGRPQWLKLAADYIRTPRFNPLDLTQDSKSVMAFNLSYLFDRLDVLGLAMGDLIQWLGDGSIRPPGTTTYALDDVADAHRAIESGKTTGKLVLLP
jgi:NADPH:quinone reductase-like Zn-dependent oxidoreductase